MNSKHPVNSELKNQKKKILPGYLGMVVGVSKFGVGKLLRQRQMLLEGFLGFIASRFNTSLALQEELKGTQGWINLSLGMKSDDGLLESAIVFKNGVVSVLKKIPDDVETVIIYKTSDDLLKMTDATPDEMYKMMLIGIMRTEGNIMLASLFNYLMSLVFDKDQQKSVDRQIEEHKKLHGLQTGASEKKSQPRFGKES
ncbi:MAG: hypothetical protein NTW65_06940 [Deltaproteobacteria bacterium]|nr:hypothetical protein [Deltaproteobacteria bacterium]